jgi:hypothetical protein
MMNIIRLVKSYFKKFKIYLTLLIILFFLLIKTNFLVLKSLSRNQAVITDQKNFIVNSIRIDDAIIDGQIDDMDESIIFVGGYPRFCYFIFLCCKYFLNVYFNNKDQALPS